MAGFGCGHNFVPMSAGPRNFLTPKEPNENKGGFRKVKRGEGAASVWGVSSHRASDLKMRVLGVVFLVICFGVPVSAVLGACCGGAWPLGMLWGFLVIAHLYMIASEMITHRELPSRGLGMLVCWGTFPLGWFLAWTSSLL